MRSVPPLFTIVPVPSSASIVTAVLNMRVRTIVSSDFFVPITIVPAIVPPSSVALSAFAVLLNRGIDAATGFLVPPIYPRFHKTADVQRQMDEI